MSETPTIDPAEAAAVLRAMAEHGIRIDDRKFERYVLVLLAERDQLRAIEQRARDQLNGPNRQDAQTARYILGQTG